MSYRLEPASALFQIEEYSAKRRRVKEPKGETNANDENHACEHDHEQEAKDERTDDDEEYDGNESHESYSDDDEWDGEGEYDDPDEDVDLERCEFIREMLKHILNPQPISAWKFARRRNNFTHIRSSLRTVMVYDEDALSTSSLSTIREGAENNDGEEKKTETEGSENAGENDAGDESDAAENEVAHDSVEANKSGVTVDVTPIEVPVSVGEAI